MSTELWLLSQVMTVMKESVGMQSVGLDKARDGKAKAKKRKGSIVFRSLISTA